MPVSQLSIKQEKYQSIKTTALHSWHAQLAPYKAAALQMIRQKFSIILECISYLKTSCQEKILDHLPAETQESVKFWVDKPLAL